MEETSLSNNEQLGNDIDNLIEKLDDIDVELETQTDHLKTIKLLLIILVILLLPVALFVIYIFYVMNNMRFSL